MANDYTFTEGCLVKTVISGDVVPKRGFSTPNFSMILPLLVILVGLSLLVISWMTRIADNERRSLELSLNAAQERIVQLGHQVSAWEQAYAKQKAELTKLDDFRLAFPGQRIAGIMHSEELTRFTGSTGVYKKDGQFTLVKVSKGQWYAVYTNSYGDDVALETKIFKLGDIEGNKAIYVFTVSDPTELIPLDKAASVIRIMMDPRIFTLTAKPAP